MSHISNTLFNSLLDSKVAYGLKAASFSLYGRQIQSNQPPRLIHHYLITPPESFLEAQRTIETDVFSLRITRITDIKTDIKLSKFAASHPDIKAFNSLIDYDIGTLLGKLSIADENKQELYDFKVLRPGHINRINDAASRQSTLCSTFLICGSIIPIPITLPIATSSKVEEEDEERDRFDLLIDEEFE